MKKMLLILGLISGLSFASEAQGWVKSFGDVQGTTVIRGVVADSGNQPVVTGNFTSETLDLDGSNSIKNNGIGDVFLVKYSVSGELLWKVSFGGEKAESVNGICMDDQDNIYITGQFSSSSFSIGEQTITSSWPDNIYVAKFGPEGNLDWFRHSGGITSYVYPRAVRYSEQLGILFTGFTNASNVSFGDINLSVNSGYQKGYYGVIDMDGNFIQADLVGETGENGSQYRFNDITSDSQGNLYLAGSKVIHTEPDPVTWNEFRDVMYLARIGDEGATDWTIEDTALFQADRIISTNDSLIVAGSREEYRYIFNGGTIDTTSAFYYGAYDLGGNLLWGNKHVGGLAYDAYAQGNSIILIGGLLKDNLEIGSFQLNRNADSSSICPIYQDIFYLETDKSGDLKQAESISGSLEDIPTAVWLDREGDLLYAGIFESYSLTIEEQEILNPAELTVFQHVSGTYYDRSLYTFLARSPDFGSPVGTIDPKTMEFRLYPNPAKDQVRIDLETGSGQMDVRVYDLHGRMIGSTRVGNGESIDLSGLSAGMYIVSCTSGTSTGYRQLVITGR